MSNSDLDLATVLRILPRAEADDVDRLVTSTRPTSVRRQWERLRPVLTTNLHVEYFGATDEAITAAETATCPWTDEMRESSLVSLRVSQTSRKDHPRFIMANYKYPQEL
ncbi:hypothetical protein ACWDTG_26440, partial [Rhodococcus zopfii]